MRLLKSIRDLGFEPVFLNALYKTGLRLGVFRWLEKPPAASAGRLVLPEVSLDRVRPYAADGSHPGADAVLQGEVIIFGGLRVPLIFEPATPVHWSRLEGRLPPGPDIKFTWEPARFGWVFDLVSAYAASGDERLPQAFWQQFEAFQTANPPFNGLNWLSGQEAALRLMAQIFGAAVFIHSPESTSPRLEQLARAAAWTAARIEPTLLYARSQNNNHLLSEAAGLYAAGLCLPEHPRAAHWRRLGLEWFSRGVLRQVSPDGEYVQYSTNYHRLMLQLGLWFDWLGRQPGGELLAPGVRARLGAAAGWLRALTDPESGLAPNFGANDGACIFPLAAGGFADHRPVVQAATLAFDDHCAYPPGPWDELSAWFDLKQNLVSVLPSRTENLPSLQSGQWQAFLRLQRQWQGRPSHADQLHLDVWWRGINVACDAGTYLYNAPPPWDNALASTAVHNTVSVDGRDQMARAGRFLWLDWARAEMEATSEARLAAHHDGYRRLGILHRRCVERIPRGLLVRDDLLPSGNPYSAAHAFRLHWLLPDFPYTFEENGLNLRLETPAGSICLAFDGATGIQIVRAGQIVTRWGTEDACPTVNLGWRAPSYGEKIPALSVVIFKRAAAPLSFSTRWQEEG